MLVRNVSNVNNKQNFNGSAKMKIVKNETLKKTVHSALPAINKTLKDKKFDVFITNKTHSECLDITAGVYPQQERRNNVKLFLPESLCQSVEKVVKATEAAIFHAEEKRVKVL